MARFDMTKTCCEGSAAIVQILEYRFVEILALYAMSSAKPPSVSRTRSRKNSSSGDKLFFGPFYKWTGELIWHALASEPT